MGGWDESSPEEQEKRKQEALDMIRGTLGMASKFKSVIDEFADDGELDDLFNDFPEVGEILTPIEPFVEPEETTQHVVEPAMTQQQVLELLTKGKKK